MARAGLLAHCRQKLLAKLVSAQAPTLWHEVACTLGAAARLHQADELLPPSGTVLGNAPFAEQAVHAQPSRTTARLCQVQGITAPGVGLERLLGSQQTSAHRVQMHVVAHRFEIARTAGVPRQGFVAAAEAMPEFRRTV